MRKLNHIGIPTKTKQENEIYNEGIKVFLTDFSLSANKIEFLRFDSDSEFPQLIQDAAHIAYEVESLEEEVNGKKVLVEPVSVNDSLRIAFIEEEGIAIELMQFV
jgi:hypothetical protein